jgi:MFS transporter, putative metabolite:H+ symporter
LIFFTPEALSPFSILAPYGVAGVGTFVFALFAGLFVGAIFLGYFADRWVRLAPRSKADQAKCRQSPTQ